MGRRREERAEKMLCCVQSKNEMGRRGKNSVSLHMYGSVVGCHVCLHSCTLIDSHMRVHLCICESVGSHYMCTLHHRVCAPCDNLRNSSMLALEAPRRFEAKQV